ncbi:hypothetical protein FRC00_002683, partial [Tulasnella sp. 408]
MVLTRSKAVINYKEQSDDKIEDLSMREKGATKEESQYIRVPDTAGTPPAFENQQGVAVVSHVQGLSHALQTREPSSKRFVPINSDPPLPGGPHGQPPHPLTVQFAASPPPNASMSGTPYGSEPADHVSSLASFLAGQPLSNIRIWTTFGPFLRFYQGRICINGHSDVCPSDDYYRIDELQKMSETVEQYQFRFEARDEGAHQEFECLIEKIRSEASERIASAKTLREWTEDSQRLRIEVELQLKEARKEEIISRLVKAGHDVRDVRQAAFTYRRIPNLFWGGKPLTAAAWERIKPKAERFVEEQTQLRLEAEEDPIKRSRRSTFRQAYSTFKSSYSEFPKTLVPSERFILKTHKGIKAVIEAEGTDTTPTMFDTAFNELPDYVDRWRNERKLELTRLVLEARIGPGEGVDLQTAEEQGILCLATSVFATCGYGDTFSHDADTVHWFDSIGEHSRKKIYHTPSPKSPLSYDEMQCIRVLPHLVDHVKLLVQAVGLDPNTSTAAEMDMFDARFYCDDCGGVNLRAEASALSWRDCV